MRFIVKRGASCLFLGLAPFVERRNKGQKGKQSECAEKQNPNGTKRADVRVLFP